jgi:hypothetical protein
MKNQRVSYALLAVALAISALLMTPVSYADSYARIVRLSDVDGDVQIDRNTGNGFEKAVPNMPITQGVRLQTGQDGRAEVEFENGSVIRFTGDSSAEFSQLSLRSNGDRANEVRVNDGTVYLNYKHKGDEDFRLSFSNRGLTLTRDVHFRLRVERSAAELAVFKGDLRLEGPSESAKTKIKKNETVTLDLNDGARYTFAKGTTDYPTDNWDRERTQYLNQYASNKNYSGSPYSYGFGDLNRYGTFFDSTYGLVWRPSSFGAGWDPFQSGYWSSYPGYGYVWVSSYPWGWAPYRYGSWVFLQGTGWCWRPGNWNRWNSVPVVTNPPPAWRPPVPPTHGGGTTVVVGPPVVRPPVTPADNINPRRPRRGEPGVVVAQPGTTKASGNNGTAPTNAAVKTVNPTTPQAVAPAQPPAYVRPNKSGRENDPNYDLGFRPGRQAAPAATAQPATKSAAPPAAAPQPATSAQPSRPTPPSHMERSAPPAPRSSPPPAASMPHAPHSEAAHPSHSSTPK